MSKGQALGSFFAIQAISFMGVLLSGIFSEVTSNIVLVAAIVGPFVIATIIWGAIFIFVRAAQNREKA